MTVHSTDRPRWADVREWTEDLESFGFVAERARNMILMLLDLLDSYADCLVGMVCQHCQDDEPEIYMDMALSANEDAFFLLEQDGLMERQPGKLDRYKIRWDRLGIEDTQKEEKVKTDSEKKIKDWCLDHGHYHYGEGEKVVVYDPLIVTKLRERGLADHTIVAVLETLDEVCHECLDGEAGCRCWDDS